MAEEALKAPPTAEEFEALKAERDSLKGKADQADDFKRTAEFWHGQAKGGAVDKTKQGAADQADEDETDLLEIVTSKGAKGLDELLAKRGFVKAIDVDNKVNAKVSQVEREGQLLKEYPQLGDKTSDFFKDTATAFGALKASGVPEGEAMSLAAERTALAHIRAGKMKTPQQVTEETKAAKEATRLARVKAQAGEADNRRAAGADDDEEGDGELTDVQRRIATSMLVGLPGKDGKPMDEAAAIAAYQTRAKSGVAMSSKR